MGCVRELGTLWSLLGNRGVSTVCSSGDLGTQNSFPSSGEDGTTKIGGSKGSGHGGSEGSRD